MSQEVIFLCPGQGAQVPGMGREWQASCPEAAEVFREADRILGDTLGAPLSSLCFEGPAERLHRTDACQPALYTCAVACGIALQAQHPGWTLCGAAGLSLGEYSALYFAGACDFETGLKLVTSRGRLMQDAVDSGGGGMVAIIGASDEEAEDICRAAHGREVLVPANYNAPGQVVLSGDASACARAVDVAEAGGFRAARLDVAGAFHSPIMQPAADGMAEILESMTLACPAIPVWSNVTSCPHDAHSVELLKQRLVSQIVSPVKWAQSCRNFPGDATIALHELAPGSVLRGLMRRINRDRKVMNHDQP